MSQYFMLAACSAPLAHYSYSNDNNITVYYDDIAPKETWYEPFRQWLENVDTINTIMDTIYALDFFGTDDTWGQAILDYLGDIDPIANDPGFIAYCTTLDEKPYISEDDPDTYAYAAITSISSHFLDIAHNAFVGNYNEATVYNGELITAGPSYGDRPTNIFNDVVLLRQINFFDDYPIAEIVNGDITGWVDHDGNPVDPSQQKHQPITPITNPINEGDK